MHLERLLRASGWMMWSAVDQSCDLITAAMLELGDTTVTTVKMLELIVEKVSWDGSCKVANMINNALSMHSY